MSKLNFRIIEGGYEDIDYEEFKKDYMNLFISKSELLKKYQINHNRYLKYGNRVFEETGFKRSRGVQIVNNSTNIRATGKRFRIDKEIRGRKLYCGTYDTFEEAKKVRDFLAEHLWSDSAIEYCMSGRLV